MNGTIQAKIKTGGGSDPETGAPIHVVSSWGDAVDCKYDANELSNKGRHLGGTFKLASYTITTQDMTFRADMIKLIDSFGNIICEKEVISLEVLEYVQRVKIII